MSSFVRPGPTDSPHEWVAFGGERRSSLGAPEAVDTSSAVLYSSREDREQGDEGRGECLQQATATRSDQVHTVRSIRPGERGCARES